MAFDLERMKAGFFDRALVEGHAEAATRKALSKMGAFVRKRARSSIRRSKKVGKPGGPPNAHAGQIKLIFFAFDAASGTVVVGPIKAGPANGAPARLEKGGTLVVAAKGGGSRVARYRAFPTMEPALAAERPKFADQFRN